MGIIIDLIGSLIVRAAIVAIILNLMINLHEALYEDVERVSLSENITGVAQTVSADIKLAGYNASGSEAYKNFITALSNDISFYADIDTNGTIDIIRYYLSNSTLKRSINGTTTDVANNVSKYELTYYDSMGVSQIGYNLNGLKSIFVEIIIQSQNSLTKASPGTSDTVVMSAKWQQHFFPDNL
ncbi:MAG: hypothetical protein M0R68_11065 [Bacteroidetes bacterium]|nr:hypothetical protein [Bacteroidota bacterium]